MSEDIILSVGVVVVVPEHYINSSSVVFFNHVSTIFYFIFSLFIRSHCVFFVHSWIHRYVYYVQYF